MGKRSRSRAKGKTRGLLLRWAIGREVTVLLPNGDYTTGVLVSQRPRYFTVEFPNGKTHEFSKHACYAVGEPVWKMKEKGDGEVP